MTIEQRADADPMCTAWLAGLDDDAREFFAERAAIIEYDAGQPRAVAEAEAQRLTLIYLQRREAHDEPD